MSNVINLSKGEKVELTRGTGVTGIRVGLNWDAADAGNGLLGGLVGMFKQAVQGDIDVDSSVFMLDSSSNIADTVYYGHLSSRCGSVRHQGDNTTGEDRGKGIDDETICIKLASVPAGIQKLVVVANIYQAATRNQHFGMISNATIKIYDQGGNVLCEYNMTKDCAKCTAIVVGEIYRHNGEWKFTALGQGTADTCLDDMRKRV